MAVLITPNANSYIVEYSWSATAFLVSSSKIWSTVIVGSSTFGSDLVVFFLVAFLVAFLVSTLDSSALTSTLGS